jgi:hypothetical protein
MPRKTKETTNLRLRVEPEVLAELEKARERHGRTLSGEIMHRVNLSFARERNRVTAFETAATILEVFEGTLSPDLPPKVAREHIQKVKDAIKRIASQLREEQERA